MKIEIFAFYSDKPANIFEGFLPFDVAYVLSVFYIYTSEHCVGLTWRTDSIAKGSPTGMSDFYPTGIADKLQQPELYVHV